MNPTLVDGAAAVSAVATVLFGVDAWSHSQSAPPIIAEPLPFLILAGLTIVFSTASVYLHRHRPWCTITEGDS